VAIHPGHDVDLDVVVALHERVVALIGVVPDVSWGRYLLSEKRNARRAGPRRGAL